MSAVARAYTFTDGTDAYGSQVETEFNTIYNAWNNHDAGTSKWTVLSSLNASAVPLIADNSSGTNDIFDAKDNGTICFKVTDGGDINCVTGSIFFGTSGKGLTGTSTNDSASAGIVGQILSSTVTAVNFAATTQYKDATSLSITAGDWDLSAIFYVNNNGATWTELECGIGTVTGNDATGVALGDNASVGQWGSSSTVPNIVTMVVPPYRVSVASTTTYYAKIEATYSLNGPPSITKCRFSARRVR